MSTWARALIAAVVGGLLGPSGGVAQLSILESFHMVGDTLTHQYFFSGRVSIVLGAFTASGLVFYIARQFKVTAWLYLIGSLSCLLWMSADSGSKLHQWFVSSNEPKHLSFPVIVLLFNGIPLLWSGVLLWCGLRLLYRESRIGRKDIRVQPEPI